MIEVIGNINTTANNRAMTSCDRLQHGTCNIFCLHFADGPLQYILNETFGTVLAVEMNVLGTVQDSAGADPSQIPMQLH